MPAVQTVIERLIEAYGLEPHPEGGYYRESYRSRESILAAGLPERFSGERSFSTAICFLLPKGERSRLHRIKADEVWHFYAGGAMTVAEIRPDGAVKKTVLGQNLDAGEKVQHVVPAGAWFGAYCNPGSDYSFVGCTVAPGFDFSDFEMAERRTLVEQFPSAKPLIERLTDA